MGFAPLFLEVQFGLQLVDPSVEPAETHHLAHVGPIRQWAGVQGEPSDHRLQRRVLDERRVERGARWCGGKLRLDRTKGVSHSFVCEVTG